VELEEVGLDLKGGYGSSKEVKEREESVPIVPIFAASVNHIEVLIAPICISPG